MSKTVIESKSAPSWKAMPKRRRKSGISRGVESAQIDAVDLDCALVGREQADHVAQQNALARPGATEQHDRLGFAHVEVDAAQHVLRPEALVHAAQPDLCGLARGQRRSTASHTHQKSTFVRKKSTMSTVMLPATTARVVDSPTPLAPPRV